MKSDQINRIIGYRIKEEREKKGLTKTDIANKLGVTRQAVAYWENGRNAITVAMLEKYCSALDMDLFDFIKKTGL